MSEKRKDSNGRVLKTGESQRKDGIYQYRYTDASGKRQTVYAGTLKALREKEDEIRKITDKGVDYFAGKITVNTLIERYLSLKKGARVSTQRQYDFKQRLIASTSLGRMQINKVKVSDVKQLILDLYEQRDYKYQTLTGVKAFLKAVFDLAYEEDVIIKNPAAFSLSGIVAVENNSRVALNMAQQESLLEFVKRNSFFHKQYWKFVILLDTGLRVSEFCGLTLSDVDMVARKIHVDHQVVRGKNKTLYIEKTKTDKGVRDIPMSERVYSAFKYILAEKKADTLDCIVDGYSGFLFTNNRGRPMLAHTVDNIFRNVKTAYNDKHPNDPLPQLTPHVLRHTYCTNMVKAGVSIKTLQYLMGHSSTRMTLDLYAHSDYEDAVKAVHSNIL